MEILNNLKRLKAYKHHLKEHENMLILINNAKNHLTTVSDGFNSVSDEDLVDYYIYEKRAAELNYKYLLKKYAEHSFNTEKPKIFPPFFTFKNQNTKTGS